MKKLHDLIDPITAALSIAMGLQLIIIGFYIGLIVWPFYYNGLHMQPSASVLDGSSDPKWLVPFCYTPPDAPGESYSRCADGTEGNPWGATLLGAASVTAFWGPFLLIVLSILVGVFLIREWSGLPGSARVVGLAQSVVVLGGLGFLGVSGLGRMLLVWIMD